MMDIFYAVALQQHCHDDPRDHDRLRHRNPAKNWDRERSLTVQLFHQLL